MQQHRKRFALAGLLVVALLAVLWLFDCNMLRQPIGSLVSQRLGRDFAINGDLRVELSRAPLIVAHDVVLANAPSG